ncbi:MAG TPA: error-prone DNA polymerase [Candidatus Obscuribacterales bacterium]
MLEAFGHNFFLELWDHHLPQEAIICKQLLDLSYRYSIPWVVTNNVHYATPAKRIIHDVLTCLRHEVTVQNAGRRLRPNGSWYLKSPEEMSRLWRHNLEGIKNTQVVTERCGFRLGLLKPSLPVFETPEYIVCHSQEGRSPDEESRLDNAVLPDLRGEILRCAQNDSKDAQNDSKDAQNDSKDAQNDSKDAQNDSKDAQNDSTGAQSDSTGAQSDSKEAGDDGRDARNDGKRTILKLTHNEMLAQLVWEGAAERYPRLTEKHFQQINHELNMIMKLDLAPYFLIMWDIVRFAQSQGIAVQGRGSAANSAVCYCLSITAVDPVGMDLLFERFLSEGRGEPPDIDLDIAHQEREKVLQYVYNKYGREHAAMVCEVITYRGPSAVRDAARVLGFSPEQADRLAAESQFHEAIEAANALTNGGAARAGLDPKDRRVQLLIKVVSGLDRLPRHRSIHVGGFVLSGEPLGQLVPIEPASMEGRTVIQWDKDDLDPVGMIKIDLLGLGMLTVIQEAVKLVKQHRGIDIDLAHLDMNDPAIYDMFCCADTIGVFQVESRAQMSILPKLRPRCFYDIVVSIALVRPGPIQGNIVHPYINRRRGDEPVTYLHPTLKPILERTLGVPLFQEQGMRLAVTAAGFTATEADQLRRVMSHKRSREKMAKLCQDLARGMEANGFSPEAIATITHQLQAFANYGFPESHAASFALLVYASAHLKKYFAPEFYCAMLNAQPMGFYSPATLIRDALRHDVEVRPVDLAKSSWDCTLENTYFSCHSEHPYRHSEHPYCHSEEGRSPDEESRPDNTALPARRSEILRCAQNDSKDAQNDSKDTQNNVPALRIGLRYVQGLGKKSKQSLEEAWRSGGRFTSIEDVCHRSGLGWKALQILARAGAFDSFCAGRRQALWKVLALARAGKELPLFANSQLSKEGQQLEALRIPDMSNLELTVADYQTTGLSTGRHPMTYYRRWAEEHGIHSCANLRQQIHGEELTVAGGVICRQRPETAKGFVFLTLEDETGMANIIVNPKVFDQYRKVLLNNDFLAITGKLQLEDGVCNVLAHHVEPLPAISSELHLSSRDFH